MESCLNIWSEIFDEVFTSNSVFIFSAKMSFSVTGDVYLKYPTHSLELIRLKKEEEEDEEEASKKLFFRVNEM